MSDWQTMGAGASLNVIVAERVLGWEFRPGPNPPNRLWVNRTARAWFRPGNPHPVSLPPLSLNISAAWHIVEEMERRGYDGSLGITHDGTWCRFTEARTGRTSHAAVDPREGTQALAVCRAALAALADA